MASINLPPVQPSLGINPTYCIPHQTTLLMREKVFSLASDTFHIVDQNNVEVLQCRGKALSFSDRKEFASSTGKPLFTLRTHHLTLLKSFYAQDPSGREIFTVKGKVSIGGSKMVAHFVNAAAAGGSDSGSDSGSGSGSGNAEVELLVKGDWFDRKAQITMGDVVVAHISRQFLNTRQLFGDQTYYVTVAPGVDLSLVAAICVCLDEKETDK